MVEDCMQRYGHNYGPHYLEETNYIVGFHCIFSEEVTAPFHGFTGCKTERFNEYRFGWSRGCCQYQLLWMAIHEFDMNLEHQETYVGWVNMGYKGFYQDEISANGEGILHGYIKNFDIREYHPEGFTVKEGCLYTVVIMHAHRHSRSDANRIWAQGEFYVSKKTLDLDNNEVKINLNAENINLQNIQIPNDVTISASQKISIKPNTLLTAGKYSVDDYRIANSWPLYKYENESYELETSWQEHAESSGFIKIEPKSASLYTTSHVPSSYHRDPFLEMDYSPTIIPNTSMESFSETDLSIEIDPQIQIFPNPTASKIIITFPKQTNNKRIELYDSSEKQIKIVKNADCITELDVSNYTSGVYILKLITKNESNEFKVIKN